MQIAIIQKKKRKMYKKTQRKGMDTSGFYNTLRDILKLKIQWINQHGLTNNLQIMKKKKNKKNGKRSKKLQRYGIYMRRNYHLSLWEFKINQQRVAIFPSVVQKYTQPYWRINLIICQIKHKLSITIHEISPSWKKRVRWRTPYIVF